MKYIKNLKQAEYFSDGQSGEHIYEFFGKESSSSTPKHSSALVEMEPGSLSKKHFHPIVEESYYILEGEGIIYLNESKTKITSGDSILIPSRMTRRVKNDYSSPLKFLVVCTPPWTPGCEVEVKN